MKILFLSTGLLSFRSLMAEGYLHKADPSLEIFSASLSPNTEVDLLAIQVMKEVDIDIRNKGLKDYHEFEGKSVDYLITFCAGTRDKINLVNIHAEHKIHLGFDNPNFSVTEAGQILDIYREIRDEICNELDYFYHRILTHTPEKK